MPNHEPTKPPIGAAALLILDKLQPKFGRGSSNMPYWLDTGDNVVEISEDEFNTLLLLRKK